VHPDTPDPLRLPGLRLPLSRRRLAPGTIAAIAAHAAIVGMVLAAGRAVRHGSGSPYDGGGSGARRVNFFALPGAAPAAVDVAAPRVTLSDLAALQRIPVALPAVELGRDAIPPPAVVSGGQGGGGGGGPGGAGVAGAGKAAGGAGVGSGTGDEAGYIFPASPRTAILPPLAKVPGAVAGRWYRVKFWVTADGRVTQVDVDPPIVDAEYGREFQQHMMAYRFYPARTRDGRTVAYVATVPLRIGN
jgi:hypothetical protein